MSVMDDAYCPLCDKVEKSIWRQPPYWPACSVCGGPRGNAYLRPIATTSWGGPRYYASLDRQFDSRSDLEAYTKSTDPRNGKRRLVQAEAAEKHHGARNEDGLNLGKI